MLFGVLCGCVIVWLVVVVFVVVIMFVVVCSLVVRVVVMCA